MQLKSKTNIENIGNKDKIKKLESQKSELQKKMITSNVVNQTRDKPQKQPTINKNVQMRPSSRTPWRT